MYWKPTPLLLAALALAPISIRAATHEQLYELRDAALPDTCAPAGAPGLGPITQGPLSDETQLYLVPCRTTFADVLSVVLLEHSGRLRVLAFPDPGFVLGDTWEDARMNRIGVTSVLSSPGITPTGDLVSTSRIAPGLGSGHILQRYSFDDGAPLLVRFAIQLDELEPITLWEAY